VKNIQTTDTFWTVFTGGFFATISYLMGGVDKLLTCLALLMVIDYITGLMCGFVEKNISSQRSYRGVAKKIAMLLFVIVANQVDIIFGHTQGELRNYILMILIATEGISLTENFAKLGLPVPSFFANALETIKNKAGGVTQNDSNQKQVSDNTQVHNEQKQSS
jgi:toxin secretion/phage lysis holin